MMAKDNATEPGLQDLNTEGLRITVPDIECICENLPALREGVEAYLALREQHRSIHAAILAAILARPQAERSRLLDTVLLTLSRSEPEGKDTTSPISARRHASSDSDDFWEDALEEQPLTLPKEFVAEDDTAAKPELSASNQPMQRLSAPEADADLALVPTPAPPLTAGPVEDQIPSSSASESADSTENIPASVLQAAVPSKKTQAPIRNMYALFGEAKSAPARENPSNATLAPRAWRKAFGFPDLRRPAAPRPAAPRAPAGAVQLADLEREAEACHQVWRTSRDLKQWERYVQLRRRIEELKQNQPKDQLQQPPQPSKNVELSRQRERHEQRLQELCRRRQRLHWTRQHHEHTLQLQMQVQQLQLREELHRLDRDRELRRAQRRQRIEQLQRELQEPQTPSETGDVFTHAWDDFQMWEHIICSPEHDKRLIKTRRGFENKENENVSAASHAATPFKKKQSPPKWEGVRYQQRKKVFEEALLAWQAQDDAVEADMHQDQTATPSSCTWAASWQAPESLHSHFRLL